MVRADLETDAAALLRPDWLTAQRWYGANDRRLASLELADAAPMPPESGQTPAAWLLVAGARFDDGGTNRYLVPAVADAVAGLHEPADGEGAWRSLASAIVSGATIAGAAGTFRCEPSASSADGDRLAGVEEHRLAVEQTNTSATLGDALILKVYRRLVPGENPELEVSTFLESVGCEVVPRMTGSMRYLAADGSSSAAAMLQERVEARGDAWAEVTTGLAGGEDMLQAIERIGRVTARMHTCLTSRPQNLAFPVRAPTAEERQSWTVSAHGQLAGAIQALSGDERAALDELAPRIRERLADAFASAGEARVTRIHGDYHLGQLLATGDGYVIVDFEGEPARPLEERRAPQPPERDVAGMLRSLDYAARTVARQRSGFDGDAWLPPAREAFLSAYTASAPSAPNAELLAAFEIEKACYEVRYEAANRPDWTWLPLDGLSRLV